MTKSENNIQTVAVIGSTGSIGRQALNVVRRLEKRFFVHSLAAHKNAGLLLEQVREFKPKFAALTDKNAASELFDIGKTRILRGAESLVDDEFLDADIIIVAITGFAAIEAVIAAIKLGKKIALATKEVLVAAGGYIVPLAKKYGAEIIPVDSEHSAIFQALDFEFDKPFEKLILTASGGPFLDTPIENLKSITPAQAVSHPNWNMGKKISVDSATMMNKGLEIIEAMHLFDCPLSKIEAVIHRQSIVHALVEFCDGSVLAKLSYPSMEIPLQLALTYPNRESANAKRIDFKNLSSLSFEEIDTKRFPCFDLALQAAAAGGVYPCALNAASEVAVTEFLDGGIKFTDIPIIVDKVLQMTSPADGTKLEIIYQTDKTARQTAAKLIKKGGEL